MNGLHLFYGLYVAAQRCLPPWVKLYILKTRKGKNMKAVVRLGYKDYVMDTEKALAILSILDEAEVYECKWAETTHAHFVYSQDSQEFIRELKILPDAIYRMGKLAGKPSKT